MHILYYSNWFIKLIAPLANALAEENQVTLIFPDISPEFNANEGRVEGLRNVLQPGVELITLRHMQGQDPLSWIPVLKAKRIIRYTRADIVHFNETYDFRCLLLMLLCPNVTFVTTVHDPIPHSGESTSLRKFKHWVRDQIRRRSDGLIVYGETLRQKLAEYSHLPLDRIHVLPHGEYRYFKQIDRGPVQSSKNGHKHVLFFGRWEHYKGMDVLVDAEPLITERVPEARIVLAGEGHLQLSELRPRMVHPDKFILKNYTIPDEEVPDLFRDADVVVLPYTEATQSGPLHIAGCFSKPTVASRVGAMPEVIEDGETGLMVSPGNPQELAEAVCRLLTHPEEAERMGEKAKVRLADQASMENVARAQIEVYKHVIESVKSGAHRSNPSRVRQREAVGS